ncbi:hypothetical protein T4B_12742 [Trichinella pseudospiralis]|uniref:Uncharacterized protein n=1 Tax=Trichinella pseudospiralis TaxID=6337 RepID=A0A0V1GLE1_TRIPS|nr:hypothetical protein T4B_12742 [Trichinella pseudospiralis]
MVFYIAAGCLEDIVMSKYLRIDVEVETLDRQAMVLSCHEKISITLSDQLEYLNVDYIDCSLSKSILHVLF